jgi:hypothetical protein
LNFVYASLQIRKHHLCTIVKVMLPRLVITHGLSMFKLNDKSSKWTITQILTKLKIIDCLGWLLFEVQTSSFLKCP